jgi:5-methylcytosine-specific restriction endonuclease McrA
LWQGFDMPLYPMPRNLNRSEKTAFLKKRIADTEHLMSGTVQFVEKNYQLFSQKLETLNQLRRQRSTSPNWLTGPSEREQKLSRPARDCRERLRSVEQCNKWIENDRQAILTSRKNISGKATPAQIQKLANGLRWVEKPAKKSKYRRPTRTRVKTAATDSNAVSFEKFKIYKAKAETLDRKNRKSQAEVKQLLAPELKKYGKCAYCENSLQFADSHIDHIQPVSKGGLSTESNCVLICAKCNRSKGATLLRPFCKRTNLDYDKVVTRLEVLGKDV